MTSLGLAEYDAQCRIENILLATEVYGASKIRRLCNMRKQGDIAVGIARMLVPKSVCEVSHTSFLMT